MAKAATTHIGRTTPRWSLLLHLSGWLLVAGLFAIAWDHAIPFGNFTRDPMSLANAAPYFGLLSNIGILFWCAAATLCFFLSSLAPTTGGDLSRRFFLCSGLLSLLLLLDDFFQLHEVVLPSLLGIRQRYVLLFYLLLAATFRASFRETIRRHHPLLLALALAFFAVSLGEDIFALAAEPCHYLVEDGAKFFGIICWFNYFALICREEVSRCIALKTQPR